MTERWTDNGNRKKMLVSHTLTMMGSDVARLVKLCPVVKEEIAWQTDGWTTDTRTDTRKNVKQ